MRSASNRVTMYPVLALDATVLWLGFLAWWRPGS